MMQSSYKKKKKKERREKRKDKGLIQVTEASKKDAARVGERKNCL